MMNDTPVSPAPSTGTGAASARKKPATRRVGTFTMGLCLIFCGTLLCVFLIKPSLAVLHLFRFSPLILVALGVELLISHLRFPRIRLKYDFLSIVVCSLVLLAGLTGTTAGICAEVVFNVPAQTASLRNDIRETCAGLLADEPVEALLVDFDYYHDFESLMQLYGITKNEMYTDSSLSLTVRLSGRYDDAGAFARASKQVIHILHENRICPGSLLLEGQSPFEDQLYQLSLDGLFAHSLTTQQLTQLADSSVSAPQTQTQLQSDE